MASHARRTILKALAVLGATVDDCPDDEEFCVQAANALLKGIMKRAGHAPTSFRDDSALVGGIFGVVFADHLTARVGGQFGLAAGMVTLDVVPWPFDVDEYGCFFEDVIAEHNRPGNGVVQAIGQNFAAFVTWPDTAKAEVLAKLFSACVRSVAPSLPSAAPGTTKPDSGNAPTPTMATQPAQASRSKASGAGPERPPSKALALIIFCTLGAVAGIYYFARGGVQQPTAGHAPSQTSGRVESVVRTETAAPWITTTETEDGTVPPTIYKREDVTDLLSDRSCEQAKRDTEIIYSEYIKAGQPVSMATMSERAAVEFFTCNPNKTTYRSDE